MAYSENLPFTENKFDAVIVAFGVFYCHCQFVSAWYWSGVCVAIAHGPRRIVGKRLACCNVVFAAAICNGLCGWYVGANGAFVDSIGFTGYGQGNRALSPVWTALGYGCAGAGLAIWNG